MLPGGVDPRLDGEATVGAGPPPPLACSDLPRETNTLALLVEDPDAPNGSFTHGLLWDIPVSRDGLDEGVEHRGWFADEMRQGDDDFDERGWSGLEPPSTETHRYVFHLYALDASLGLEAGASASSSSPRWRATCSRRPSCGPEDPSDSPPVLPEEQKS